MSGVALYRVGEINLCDLEMIGRLQGQEGLPYPFGHIHPYKQHHESISSVADRLDQGDLSAFREWTQAYIAADIWVACRVHHTERSGRRILAYRAGDAGYLASQASNDDVVEVFTLSALDLGAAIAGSLGLTEPGTQPRIVIPGYVGHFANGAAATTYDDSDDDTVYALRVAVHRPPQPTQSVVPDDSVTALGTIQSRWQPPRRWGLDWTKNVVVCIQIDADGDYVYAPDFSHAVPLTEQFLGERIDGLIAEDISALRRERGIIT